MTSESKSELDPDILAIAEEAGLIEYKKNMLVSKEILNHPDKEIGRYVQKVLLDKLVNASESKSKYIRDQEMLLNLNPHRVDKNDR